VTLDKAAHMCLNMFSCNRRGRHGFSPEEAVDVAHFARTGEVSVRALKVNDRSQKGRRARPAVIHANGNRKFLHWEQGIARALGSAAWRSGCVRAIGPGGGRAVAVAGTSKTAAAPSSTSAATRAASCCATPRRSAAS
jgi:hypothetical protein